MNILITICARGGSKRLPNKHLLDFNGKPLIQWTIDQAKSFPSSSDNHTIDLVLSSDSKKILSLANDILCIDRPFELSTGECGKLPVIRHAVNLLENLRRVSYDIIVDLDATNPLRTIFDIEAALDMAINQGKNVLSGTLSRKNPYFNVVELVKKDIWQTVGKGNFVCMQECPNTVDLNASISVIHRRSLTQMNDVITNMPFLVYLMADYAAFDIDTITDFEIAKLMGEKYGIC